MYMERTYSFNLEDGIKLEDLIRAICFPSPQELGKFKAIAHYVISFLNQNHNTDAVEIKEIGICEDDPSTAFVKIVVIPSKLTEESKKFFIDFLN